MGKLMVGVVGEVDSKIVGMPEHKQTGTLVGMVVGEVEVVLLDNNMKGMLEGK